MFNIQQYLQKFKTLTSHEGEVKDALANLLNEKYGIELDRETVTYQNKQVFIKAHPLIKNEIAQHKRAILRELRPRVGRVIDDIR